MVEIDVQVLVHLRLGPPGGLRSLPREKVVFVIQVAVQLGAPAGLRLLTVLAVPLAVAARIDVIVKDLHFLVLQDFLHFLLLLELDNGFIDFLSGLAGAPVRTGVEHELFITSPVEPLLLLDVLQLPDGASCQRLQPPLHLRDALSARNLKLLRIPTKHQA